MRLGIEAVHDHLWIPHPLQHPMIQPPPQMPFFLFPTWETTLLNPLHQTQIPSVDLELLMYLTQFFLTQVMETALSPWPTHMAMMEAQI